MVDVLTPVKEIIQSPPTGLLGLAIGPGLLSGAGTLPLVVPGTLIPTYGVSVVVTSFPPTTGRTFHQIPIFQRPYLLITVFSRTFDNFDIPVERLPIYDADAEVRWLGPGVARATYEFAPFFEADVRSLIILG